MIKIFYRLFKKDILRLVYAEQSKPKDFTDMELAFIDSNGKRYYKYKDEMDMPLKRWAMLQQFFGELTMVMTHGELMRITDAMQTALGGKDRDIAMIGFLIKEIKNRCEMLLHEEILFRIVACLYIREDEEP